MGNRAELVAGQLWRFRDAKVGLDYTVLLVSHVEDDQWLTHIVHDVSDTARWDSRRVAHDNMSLPHWSLVAEASSGHLSEP